MGGVVGWLVGWFGFKPERDIIDKAGKEELPELHTEALSYQTKPCIYKKIKTPLEEHSEPSKNPLTINLPFPIHTVFGTAVDYLLICLYSYFLLKKKKRQTKPPDLKQHQNI